jgi:hypothetical protein
MKENLENEENRPQFIIRYLHILTYRQKYTTLFVNSTFVQQRVKMKHVQK